MTLGEKQEQFQRMMTKFKTWLIAQNIGIRGGDAFRDPRVHGEMGEKMAYGHRNSCHKLKLAEDLYLRDIAKNRMLSTFDDFLPYGEYWEQLGGTWGGRFRKRNAEGVLVPNPDCVHFSLAHEGHM